MLWAGFTAHSKDAVPFRSDLDPIADPPGGRFNVQAVRCAQGGHVQVRAPAHGREDQVGLAVVVDKYCLIAAHSVGHVRKRGLDVPEEPLSAESITFPSNFQFTRSAEE